MYLYRWGGEDLWLLPEKAILVPACKTLIVSDLHLSKTGHFRKSGIPVPQKVFIEDLQTLFSLVQTHKCERVVVVGDLFHSHANKEVDLFTRWRNDFPNLEIVLIKGNHDVLSDDWYEENNIKVYDETLFAINKILFIHDITETLIAIGDEEEDKCYFISGHIHPSVHISGKGRQGLTFPCFHFSEKTAVLPAFSKFTGHASIKAKKKDNVFAIVNNTILKVH